MKKCSYCGEDVKNCYKVFFGNSPRVVVRKCGRYICRFKRWLTISSFKNAVENVNNEVAMKVIKNKN